MDKKVINVDIKKHFSNYIKEGILESDNYFLEISKNADPLNIRSDSSLGVLTHTPAVYIQVTDNGGLYVGETMDIVGRLRGHEKINKEESFCLITSNTFNKSSIYHIETKFIRNILFSNKKGLYLKNSKIIQSDYNYFMKDVYDSVADEVWNNYISSDNFLKSGLKFLKVSDVDYYKDGSLAPLLHPTNEQISACMTIINELNTDIKGKVIVEGSAGTGKTVVAALMAKHLLLENDDTDFDNGKTLLTSANKSVVEGLFKHYFELEAFKDKKIGFFTSPKKFSGLSWKEISEYNLIIMCSSVISVFGNKFLSESNGHFDVVLADEAHRYRKLDDVGTSEMSKWFKKAENMVDKVDKEFAMQWLVEYISNNSVLFNDDKQRLKVNDTIINDNQYTKHKLYTQLRIKGGLKYAKFIDSLLDDNIVSDQISDDSDEFKWKIISPYEAKSSYEEFVRNSLNHRTKNDSRILSTLSIPKKPGDTKDKWRKEFIKDFNIPVIWNTIKYYKWSSSSEAIRLESVGYSEACQGLEYNKTFILIGDNYTWDNGLAWSQKGDTNIRYYSKNDVPLTVKLMKNRLRVLLTRSITETTIVVQCKKLREKMKELSKKDH